MQIARKVVEAALSLRRRGVGSPARVILLEHTMAGFSNEMADLSVVPFGEVPHLLKPSAPGWGGALLFGEFAGERTAVQEGRVHLYDGFLPGETAIALRVLCELGAASVVFVAYGRALDPGFDPGTFLLATDRIDLTGVPPLRGAVDGREVRPAEVPPLPESARTAARAAADATGVACVEGVAALLHGPLWPTPAETRMIRGFGAVAATLALAPELAVAASLGIPAATLVLLDGAWGKPHLDFCAAFLKAFKPPPRPPLTSAPSET